MTLVFDLLQWTATTVMATLPINKGHIPYALAQIFALRKQSCRGDEVADEGSWNTTAVEVFKDDCTAEGVGGFIFPISVIDAAVRN